jgi:hypothetical protein
MQKIFRLLLVAIAILIGVVWFAHWSKSRAHNTAANNSTAPHTIAPAATPDTAMPNQTVPQETAEAVTPSVPMVPQHPGPITEQPVANSLSPHPPAGFVTPSTQKFALYRQGDLTYRLNTQSGQACVLLASDELWHKPIVYQHGCGNH